MDQLTISFEATDGYMGGFGDLDNDGADELVIALVTKEGKVIFTDPISNVISFDLK